jgi:hypothetical protein
MAGSSPARAMPRGMDGDASAPSRDAWGRPCSWSCTRSRTGASGWRHALNTSRACRTTCPRCTGWTVSPKPERMGPRTLAPNGVIPLEVRTDRNRPDVAAMFADPPRWATRAVHKSIQRGLSRLGVGHVLSAKAGCAPHALGMALWSSRVVGHGLRAPRGAPSRSCCPSRARRAPCPPQRGPPQGR